MSDEVHDVTLELRIMWDPDERQELNVLTPAPKNISRDELWRVLDQLKDADVEEFYVCG